MARLKYNIEHFKKLAEEKGGKCLSNEYINCRSKLEFQCNKGHVWKSKPCNIVAGTWCLRCGRQHLKYDLEYFKELAKNKGGICLSESYDNAMVRLQFQCDKGHIWDCPSHHVVAGTWCPECGKQCNRKHTIDDNFFSRDNEEAFYVAGFLAADGNVNKDSCTISLTLAQKDLEHLKKIKSVLNCTSTIKLHEKFFTKIVDRYVNKTLYSCGFYFNSKKCKDDLKRFSVFPNKTYYLEFPEWLQEHQLVHHFMRGYIDGDGCFVKTNKRSVFSMPGTKSFLNSFHDVLLKHGVCEINKKRKQMEAKDGKNFAAFDVLQYGGNKIISRMYDFLYKDATIFLERKEKIARKSKEYLKQNSDKLLINKLNITKENLLEKLYELDNITKTAEYFGFTQSGMYSIAKQLRVEDELLKYSNSKKIDFKNVYNTYSIINSYKKTAKFLGVSEYTVNKSIKLYGKINDKTKI
jgi:hypothetical protein